MANSTEAAIATWVVDEGGEVAVGDVLAEIETEKAVVEMHAEESGVLAKRLVEPGKVVAVGTPIAVLTASRSEEHTSELQSRENLVCRLLLEKKKHNT